MDDKKEGMNNTAPQAVVDTSKGAKDLAGNTLSGAVSGLTRKQPTRKRQKSKSVSGPTKRGSSKRRTSTSATAKRGLPKRRSASRAAKKTATKRPQSKAVKVGRAPSAKSRRTPAKADELSSLWPPANELLEKLAIAEAEKATDAAQKHAQAEAEKSDQLSKTLGISDEEVMKSAAAIVGGAVEAGLTEVQVYRFPNILCTDHGRAINQQEPGWEDTLTGVPKLLYQFWIEYLRPRGYKLRAQIVDFPDGLPGDVSMTLKWG
jgi:hypothetical protein